MDVPISRSRKLILALHSLLPFEAAASNWPSTMLALKPYPGGRRGVPWTMSSFRIY